MALLNQATLGVLILVCWTLIVLLAQHRVDRPPGLRMEDWRQFMESFKARNYDEFGRRLLPLYIVAYPLTVIIAVLVVMFEPLR